MKKKLLKKQLREANEALQRFTTELGRTQFLMASKARLIEVCDVIAQDMKNDTAKREGQPFTGENIAIALGQISAAVASLAQIQALILSGHVDG